MADLTYSVDISTKQATASLRNLQKQIKKTDNTFAKLGKSLASGSFKVASTGIKSLALAATAATAAFVGFGFKALQTLDNIEKASSKLGVSARFLTSWQKVAREAGLTTENFTIGLQRFLRRIGEAQAGTGTLVKPLQELGINLRNANGTLKDGTVVFEEYIKALTNTEDATTKLRLAFAAFDTEGVAMVNIAKMTAEEIENIQKKADEAGIVIDLKLAQAAARARDRLADLTDVAKGFGLQFFGSLAPALETFATDLRKKIIEAVEGAGGMEVFSRRIAAQFLDAMASFVDSMAGVIDGIVNAFRTGANILNDVIVAISKIPFAGFDAVTGTGTRGEAIQQLQNEIEGIDKQIEDLTQSAVASGNAMDVSTSYFIEGLMLKKKALSEQIEALSDETTMYLQKFESGSTAAQDAVSGVTDKIRAQADELEKAAKIQEDFAKFDYEDAILRIARAQEAAAAQTSGTDTTTGATMSQSELDKLAKYEDRILRIANANKAAAEANRVFGDSFRSLRDRLLPLQAAQRTYNEELKILEQAYRKGMISATDYAEATKALKEQFEEFQASIQEGPTSWLDGWTDALDEYVRKAGDAAQNAKDLFNTATRGMEDAIVEFARTGKLSFRSLLNDIAEQLLRSQIRQLMGNLFGGGGAGGGGNFFSNLFAGFFAQGGYIGGNQVGIVGERGAELVKGPANVTPLQSMGGNVTYNINAVDTDSFRNLVASDPTFIHAVVQQGQQEFRSA